MARRVTGGQIALDYLTDLVVTVGVVLVCGWLAQISLNDMSLRQAQVGQDALFVAINRFTPPRLFASYVQTISQTARDPGEDVDISKGVGSALRRVFSLIGHAALTVTLAAPQTLLQLYQESSGLAAWIVLAGFALALCGVFLWLVAGGRITLFRIVVALALSPIVVSGVFLLLQIFMFAMFEAFYWFTVLAPYAVACPVVCTLYWLVFPHAARGMTHTLLRAIGNALRPNNP